MIFFFFVLPNSLEAQVVLQIDAGSRAPWGNIQTFTMDISGNCQYLLHDVESGIVKDSASFLLSKNQMDIFFQKAKQVGFFELKEKYLKGLDGSGIFISLTNSGKKNTVTVTNTDVPAIAALLETLNELLKPRKIHID